MDGIITFFKWVFGIVVFILVSYIITIYIYGEIKKKEDAMRYFPCTHIRGKCTIKPTYENCKSLGSIPDNVCERKLNRTKK